jgi:glycosyltransferase involved in cell wall biosynthesis
MSTPRVSFLVPCFRLAHFLRECVQSILDQTYTDFEIIILDDCSPDDTPAVARTITDPRVRYVRHEKNLGHLGNYNRGLELARGEYVWLISADDAIHDPTVLAGHVAALDATRDATFVFGPAVKVRDGEVVGTFGPRTWTADRVFDGPAFYRHIIKSNFVCAPTALARRSAYAAIGMFPQDLPYAGDWFVWCAFALRGKVVYRSAPVARYRVHDGSLTEAFYRQAPKRIADEIEVRWRSRRHARELGKPGLFRPTEISLACDYAERLRRKREENWIFGLAPADVEQSIAASAADRRDADLVSSLLHEHLGDQQSAAARFELARAEYVTALRLGSVRLPVLCKFALATLGRYGRYVRGPLAAMKQRFAGVA